MPYIFTRDSKSSLLLKLKFWFGKINLSKLELQYLRTYDNPNKISVFSSEFWYFSSKQIRIFQAEEKLKQHWERVKAKENQDPKEKEKVVSGEKKDQSG